MIDHIFSVTTAASEAARKQLEKRGTPQAFIRLGVKGGGCSGMQYVVQFEDDNPRERDTVIDAEGVKFLIDNKSLALLKGSTLDYVKALMFEGYRFINPQELGACGCGHSFSVKA